MTQPPRCETCKRELQPGETVYQGGDLVHDLTAFPPTSRVPYWCEEHGANPTAHPRFAIIHVKPDANTQAWPVVERVPGGWQSGVHHYPDRDVLSVKPLHLAPTTDVTATLAAWERDYVRALNAILAAYDDSSADAHRWRGHAEAYRQVCERLRRDHGMEPAAYTSTEWRQAHGVYSDEQVAEFRRFKAHWEMMGEESTS